MRDLKPVLFITYYYPPSGGPAVQRVLKFTKYLPVFGYKPIVLTVEDGEYSNEDPSLAKDIPPEAEICRIPIWEPYSIYKRFTGQDTSKKISVGFLKDDPNKKPSWKDNIAVWIRGNFFIPDARVFWMMNAPQKAVELIHKHDIKLIFSSGPPHTVHLIAQKVKNLTGVAWFADFRDPWTQIDFYHQLKLSWLADTIHHQLEKSVMDSADYISVVGPTMKRNFSEITKTSVTVITNGFDADDMTHQPENKSSDKIVISHIGNMNKDRNPVDVWDLLVQKVKTDSGFREKLVIKLIGNVDVSIFQSLEEKGLGSFVQKKTYIPHEEAIGEMYSSSILLMVINQTPGSELIISGKIFEYIATGKPILFSGPIPGDAFEILKESGRLITPEFLLSDQFSLDSFVQNKSDISKYSRKSLTRDLASKFDEIYPVH